MSLIKTLSVGDGDMFYIRHNSDNFTMIDCRLPVDDTDRHDEILDELVDQQIDRSVVRFISTHPDQDHVQGLEALDDRLGLLNFYCVKNATTKDDETPDFKHYCQLRDDPVKAYYISAGCQRKWMNISDAERGAAGITILWPDTDNLDFRDALRVAEEGGSPNNTSAIIKYSLNDGVSALWMGDLETDFMERIDGCLEIPEVDLLFAPHHGRKSGRVPASWLKQMDPKVIVLGDAPSEYKYYYPGYNTLSQTLGGDFTFDCAAGVVHVYSSVASYEVDFLDKRTDVGSYGHYLGSFDV